MTLFSKNILFGCADITFLWNTLPIIYSENVRFILRELACFWQLVLHPDTDDSGYKYTSKSADSQHPVFNEKFSFPLEEVSLADSCLIVRVADQDTVNEDIELLGEVVIHMSDINFMDTPIHTSWYTLRPEV